jgi:NAD(P) transhydrogenase
MLCAAGSSAPDLPGSDLRAASLHQNMNSDPQPQRYDLIVIGSGPAGEKGAFMAGFFGKKVALIEKDPALGGASTNTGTIPSKTLRETALALSGLRARELYGVDLSLRREATVADFMYHEERVKSHERERIAKAIHRGNVDLYHGMASFADPHTIHVNSGDGPPIALYGEKILIATGSSPVRPEGFDFPDPRILDSDEILTMERLPKTMAVIGAGVIGSEYACTFAALGCNVFLIDGRDVLLPFLDRELSVELANAIQRLGITLVWNEKVTSCEGLENGPVRLTCSSGRQLDVDAVLVAAGRSSNTAQLNLAAAGITPGPRGLITVDHEYRTSTPHIFAAGDVIGFPALAATSAEQARVAVCYAFNLGYKNAISPILPTGIYTIPEVSMVGDTEESLQSKGVDYVVGRAPYVHNARGQIIGSTGFLKLLFERQSMKLVGVHVMGEQATEVVHIGLIAMLTGSTAELFSIACFNYPTLGELYKYAAYVALVSRDGPDLLEGRRYNARHRNVIHEAPE